jgi:MFS family permease
VSLQAPAIAISLLGSVPALLGAVLQMAALRMIDPCKPRRYYVVRGMLGQSIALMGAAAAGWFPGPWSVALLITSLALYGACGAVFISLWLTWFSDLVPDEIMGRHTAWRSRFFSLTQLATSLSVGLIARHFTAATTPWFFYSVVFVTAAAMRLGCCQMVSRQYEPPRGKPFANLSFSKVRPPRALLSFGLAMGLFNGAAGMSGPFFSVWFLRDLQFNYLVFTINSACPVLATMLALPFWGRLTDRLGPSRVLRLAAPLAAIVPLPFLFVHDPVLVCASNFYSGIAWTGVNTAAFKLQLRMAGKEHPEHNIAIVNMLQTSILLVFSLVGGYLATRLPVLFTWRLQTLFFLSALLRLTFYLVAVSRLREHPGPDISWESLTRRLWLRLGLRGQDSAG